MFGKWRILAKEVAGNDEIITGGDETTRVAGGSMVTRVACRDEEKKL